MSFNSAKASIAADLAEIKAAGLWKTERFISSDQKNLITLADGSEVLNMCANNYLKQLKIAWINGVLVWLLCALFAARKPCIKR